MRLGAVTRCVGCDEPLEWSVDRQHNVVLIEATSRATHVCPRRPLAVLVPCGRGDCRARVTTYSDGSIEEWPSGKPHLCRGVWAGWNDEPAVAS